MFVLKKYLYHLSIQLIFSFFLFLPRSFAYEQDIYFYPTNGDTNFMLRELIHKKNLAYFNDLNKYLRYQTPYFSTVSKLQVEPEKSQQIKETPEDILQNDTSQTEDFSELKNYAEIVIIIDDMGVNRNKTQKISSLQYPIMASFLTYAPHLKEQIKQSQNSGQEIMVHVPMEPNVMQNYTDQMLTTDMTDEEITKTLENMLQQIPQAVGINNHMGSKFTEDEHRMGVVMQVLAEKKLIFVDSKTTAKTAGYKQSQLFGIKSFIRDIFLDNKDDYNYILSQLQKTEKIAHKTGLAIAIGHPKEQTYQALKDWLPTLKDKGLKLIPISKINNHNESHNEQKNK